ncbi:uncharacterized protein RJT21DRAFT_38784 [Scheffersomyces amazonensis]|uniref:uncharacterized protein n=1 Tax=Scheffersomyces amazonensis TaxID=1078765 RepID=UPI00315CCAD7
MDTSRLDQICALVNSLEHKSNQVFTTASQTSSLLNTFSHSITQLNREVDDITHQMENNYTYVREFTNLYEKAFYLETSITSNDHLTNLATFDNLAQEYKFLLDKLSHNESISTINDTSTSTTSTTTTIVKPISNKISVSNLQLKPIRCNSKKVYKRKSKYRLSGIFNVNPVSISTSNNNNNSTINSNNNTTSNTTTNSNSTSNSVPELVSSSSTNNSSLLNNSDLDLDLDLNLNLDMGITNQLDTDTETIATLPTSPGSEKFYNYNYNYNCNYKHHRSNSLPEANSSGLFAFPTPPDNDEQLRINRLKHFISFGNLHDLHHSPALEEPEPETASINLNSTIELDNLSICSEVSTISPPTTMTTKHLQSDTFENYLRKSHIDLQQSFPNILRKSSSFDSFLSEAFEEPPPPPPPHPQTYRIHNPIENIHLSTSQFELATETTEPIYSRKKKRVTFEDDDPKRKLSDIILANENIKKQMAAPPSPSPSPTSSSNSNSTPSTPTKSKSNSKSTNFSSLFGLSLISPKRDPSTTSDGSTTTTTTNTIEFFGKSLTDSLMNLVSTPTPPTKSKSKSNSKSNSNSNGTPDKIRDLKRRSRQFDKSKSKSLSISISIPNDNQSKRLPIRIPKPNGGAYSSSLTIGPNHTTIIHHGESSVFRKPVMSKVSHQSLREALSQSLLE